MEKSKKALEALRNDLHHVPMTDRLASAFRHLDAALSALEGSKPKEPPRYVMSKDYDALYELLCNGGEALGTCLDVDEGECVGTLITDAEIVDGEDHFIAECTRLNLEWIAVEPPKEQGAEPVATPTCEPIYGDYGGINGYSCSNCSAPIGPPEFSRYCGNCARKVSWPEGANYQTHPPKPSIMVGFSEEEVRLIADEVAEDCGVDDETEYGAYTWKCMLECAMKVHEAHTANTRAVSIDLLVEVVREATWINDVDLLRERLMKIMP